MYQMTIIFKDRSEMTLVKSLAEGRAALAEAEADAAEKASGCAIKQISNQTT